LTSIDAVIGLGANLGDRIATLRGAVDALAQRGARVEAVSAVYETAPVGPPQPDYLNAAIRVTWPGTVRSLLEACLAVEASFGRVRRERWGPRSLDLDVLWVRDVVVDEPGLEVPHPRLRERPFALFPFVDVARDARDPRSGEVIERPAGEPAEHGVRRTGLALGR
jgi:2-amino-4-hydroxy-6-hydroxymethyldihydropteridine diphosphokinase